MRRALHGGLALLVLGATGACFIEDLLTVKAPSRVPADAIEDPRNARLIVTSVVADFECALASFIAAGGLLGDELVDAQLAARMWDYDRRSVVPSGEPVYAVFTCGDADPGVYQTLHIARAQADNAVRLLRGCTTAEVSSRDSLMAVAAAYGGYAYLLLGEALCTAAVDGGPELTSQQVIAHAEERFSLVLDTLAAAAPAAILNTARVGRARARLDRANTAGALGDAALVPPGFRHNARFSAASFRSSNRIWTLNNRDSRITIEDDFRRVMHMGAPDTLRVPVDSTEENGVNNQIRIWEQKKYAVQDSPIPIARYAEAQLIIAEVRRDTQAVRIINELHAAAGLPPFAAADPDSILRHVIEERRLELFLEGHHFYDKLRFNAALDPDPLPDTPAPGASYINGGTYGATVCLPLPDVERLNNPNIP
jgi:hypothetical protein